MAYLSPRRRTTIRLWAKRIAAVAAVSAAVATGTTAAANASTAGTDAVGFYYELRNLHTNKCADVTDRSTSWNAVVHQWSCANQTHQLWAVEWLNLGNNVRLRNLNSQFCLAAGFPYYSGETVRQLECEINDSSGRGNIWTLVADGGSYKLVHYYSQLAGFPPMCLDLDRGSTSNGAKIQILTCDTSSNAQNWYFA